MDILSVPVKSLSNITSSKNKKCSLVEERLTESMNQKTFPLIENTKNYRVKNNSVMCVDTGARLNHKIQSLIKNSSKQLNAVYQFAGKQHALTRIDTRELEQLTSAGAKTLKQKEKINQIKSKKQQQYMKEFSQLMEKKFSVETRSKQNLKINYEIEFEDGFLKVKNFLFHTPYV